MTLIKALQHARTKLLVGQPFFAALLLTTPMIETKGIPTAATDMKVIFYNPEFIEQLKSDVVPFVLAHEALHIMLKHGLRRQSRKMKQWNIACDHAINLMLKASGFTIWEHCYCNPKYIGWSAEDIYTDEDCENGGSDGKGIGDDLIETPGLSQGEMREIEREINQRVAQAASIGRSMGTMPGDLERMVNGILNPPLPWWEVLFEYATQRAADDESWSRRNRRYSDIYMPIRDSVKMGEIVVIGDTSGSMDDAVYPQLGFSLEMIAELLKPERIRVIWADDDECSRQEVFEDGEPIILHPLGGGGTDMRKPLKFVEEFDPLICVLVTDCYTPWPNDVPYPLVVLSSTHQVAPIGTTVHLSQVGAGR